jgi:ArsR family transcriptional regulator
LAGLIELNSCSIQLIFKSTDFFGETMKRKRSKSDCGILKVLADEIRLAVVRQLLDGPQTVGALNADLKVESTLLSHHLRVLRESGLVLAEREGKAVRYRLADSAQAHSKAALNLGCCTLTFSGGC